MTGDDLTFDVVDPTTDQAVWAMRRYFAELDHRFPAGFDPGDALEAGATDLAAPTGAFVVVRAGDRAVACGGLQRVDDATGEVKRIWVDPGWRRRGVARRLMERLEAIAVAHGHRRVVLDTNGVLAEAIAMYEALGYDHIERYNDNPYAQRWFAKDL